jgi:hypothetical protein
MNGVGAVLADPSLLKFHNGHMSCQWTGQQSYQRMVSNSIPLWTLDGACPWKDCLWYQQALSMTWFQGSCASQWIQSHFITIPEGTDWPCVSIPIGTKAQHSWTILVWFWNQGQVIDNTVCVNNANYHGFAAICHPFCGGKQKLHFSCRDYVIANSSILFLWGLC